MSYLIVIVIKRDLILLVEIIQVLRKITHSELVPPFAVRVFPFVLFLNLHQADCESIACVDIGYATHIGLQSAD